MRVLFVHPSALLTGAGRVLALLAKGLRERGHQTLVIVPASGPLTRVHREDLGPIRVVPMTPPGRAWRTLTRHLREFPMTTRALMRVFREWPPDLVHVHGIYTLWAGIAARRARLPCLYHIHEAPESYPRWLYRGWQRIVARLASHIVLVHPHLCAAWASWAERTTVIENGVDVARIRARAVVGSSAAWRASWGDFSPLILCPAHIMPGKNQHLLVRAAPLILRELPRAGIVFLGRTHGRAAHEAYLDQLRRWAQAAGCGEHIRFAEEPEDAHEAYGVADIVVSTSPRESFGLVPLEALAAGRPVVAVRTGIVSDLHARGYAVHPVSPDDPEEMARAILQMAKRPSQGRTLPPEYQAEYVVERFEALYREILAQARDQRS